MRRLLAITATVVIVGGIATASAASAASSPSPSPDDQFCFQPKSLTVAGHVVMTPEICIPIP